MGQTGPDKGKGGKYLVLPPGAEPPADAGKYYLAKSQTMNVLVGLRVLDPDPAKGKALVEQFRMYPYVQAGRARPDQTALPRWRSLVRHPATGNGVLGTLAPDHPERAGQRT